MAVVNAKVSVCTCVHPPVQCVSVSNHVSMSSKGFNQSPGAHQRVSFNSITVLEFFFYFCFCGGSKQKFVPFLIGQERFEEKKSKSESQCFTHMAHNGLQYRIISVHRVP